MALFLQERWGVRFESRSQMLQFLGIEFLVKKEKIDIDALIQELRLPGNNVSGLTSSSSGCAKGARR